MVNLLTLIAEGVRLGARTLTPSYRDLLEEHDQRLKEFKEELERQEQEESERGIKSNKEALSALRSASENPNPESIEELVEYYTKNEGECPIAEYLSLALTQAKYGSREKAKELIKDVIEQVEEEEV